MSPIEWRLKDGKPLAAIERWNVGDETDPAAASWLVVTALREIDSCHVHYVSGSYPNANEQARRAADDLAEDFDCENDVPTIDSKIGAPRSRRKLVGHRSRSVGGFIYLTLCDSRANTSFIILGSKAIRR